MSGAIFDFYRSSAVHQICIMAANPLSRAARIFKTGSHVPRTKHNSDVPALLCTLLST